MTSSRIPDMGLPEIADFARKFAVMVRVQGPDPKGLKMRKHAFHQHHSGKTTLSASGMLLPDSLHKLDSSDVVDQSSMSVSTLVITVASVLEPFLSLKHRENVSETRPELIPGVHLDVMVEDKREGSLKELDEIATCWYPAELLSLVDVSEASLALQSLFEASSGSLEHGWEVGWSLASYSNDAQTQIQSYTDLIKPQRLLGVGESGHSSLLSKSTTRIALLQVSLKRHKDLSSMVISPTNKRGDLLLATGSPFGILSPSHFYNSISVGSIANCHPSSSSRSLLLMADIRCLPGMEGGPVFGVHAHLIGILTRPLRQKSTGAEVQLVIPWEAIATACTDLLQTEYQVPGKEIGINDGNINRVGTTLLSRGCGYIGTSDSNYGHSVSGGLLSSSIEKAMASICLVTVGDGIWASGILLNNKGLILTNAHLLEPWRFGRASVNYGRAGNNSELFSAPNEESLSLLNEEVAIQQKSQGMLPILPKIADFSVVGDRRKYDYGANYSGHRSIRVRLDHIDPWIWCDAAVMYISQGPLDIALLKLDSVPDNLCPIVADLAYPSPGSKAYVIGHGLFGPRSDILPSVCAGVVSKVVKTKMLHSSLSNPQEYAFRQVPAMLETTAAVHPGGSGGVIVNSNGQMIGLVTSNARHGGGMVIPYLNFSIPCAVLEPAFIFSKDMQVLSLLQELDKPNEQLSSVWALMPPLSPKPGPSAPDLPQSFLQNSKEGKGSRFANFIAEKKEVFKKAGHLGKGERLSSDILPSKL